MKRYGSISLNKSRRSSCKRNGMTMNQVNGGIHYAYTLELLMMRPTAVFVEPVENYQLMVEFDNGEKKKFDVKPYIQGSFYGQLSDPACFKSVRTNGYSVEWENGQDLCPDELYYNSIPASRS